MKLYAPLGVGSHVDHFLCCQAANQLHEHGHQVCFYEDFPYCDPSYPYTEPDEGVLHSSLAEELAKSHANLASRLLYLEDEDLNRKIEAILTYESQLDIVFTRNADIRSQVITYMKSLGSGKPVERFWVFGA